MLIDMLCFIYLIPKFFSFFLSLLSPGSLIFLLARPLLLEQCHPTHLVPYSRRAEQLLNSRAANRL